MSQINRSNLSNSLNMLCNATIIKKIPQIPQRRKRIVSHYELKKLNPENDYKEDLEQFLASSHRVLDPDELVKSYREKQQQDSRDDTNTQSHRTIDSLQPKHLRAKLKEPIVLKMKREIQRLFPGENQKLEPEKLTIQQKIERQIEARLGTQRSKSQDVMKEVQLENEREHKNLVKCIDEVNKNKFVDFHDVFFIFHPQKRINFSVHEPDQFIRVRDHTQVHQVNPEPKENFYNEWYIQPKQRYLRRMKPTANLPQQFMYTPNPQASDYFYRNLRQPGSSWKKRDPFENQPQVRDDRIHKHLQCQEIVRKTRVLSDYKAALERQGKRVPIFLVQ